jgi:peroxiredoxin
MEVLERNPQHCRFATEADDVKLDLRELLFGRRNKKYRILFVVRDNIVSILHIRHSARDALSVDDIARTP